MLFQLISQKYIFCDCQARNQGHLLENHSDSIFFCIICAFNFFFFTLYDDFSTVFCVNTGHNLHQSGFSGSITANKSMHFTFCKIKINAF